MDAEFLYQWRRCARLRLDCIQGSTNRLVPGVYLFFAVSFGLFYLATQAFDDHRLIDKSFYVWVSFFALFHVSVFWSFMSDLYSSAQSKRLFGLFGAGASIGAVTGPLLPVLLGTRSGFITCC